MSGNPKPQAGGGGGPQTQRYNGPYPYWNDLKNEGSDGYQQPQGTYVTHQPNQGGNQQPGIRGLPQTGPPNQAPTPPNVELKAINSQIFVPNNSSRSTTNFYQPRTNVQASQQRMPNHTNRPAQPNMFQPSLAAMPPIYITTSQPPVFMPTPRPSYMQSPYPIFPGHSQPIAFQYQHASASHQQSMPYFGGYVHSAGPPPPAAVQSTTIPPTMQNMTMSMVPPQSYSKKHIRRANAIAVIDPTTGEDRLKEVFDEDPSSGSSSARQTPKPSPHYPTNTAAAKEIQATLVKQVAARINSDEGLAGKVEAPVAAPPHHLQHHHMMAGHLPQQPQAQPPQPHHHHVLAAQNAPPPLVPAPQVPLPHDQIMESMYVAGGMIQPQPQQANKDLEHLVQSSKLQVNFAQAKEFVSSSNTAKETPIVSANCDSAEVTLINKQSHHHHPQQPTPPPQQAQQQPQKDRESPAKGSNRKPPPQQQQTTLTRVVKDDSKQQKVNVQQHQQQPPPQQHHSGGNKDNIKEEKPVRSASGGSSNTTPTQAPTKPKDQKFESSKVPSNVVETTTEPTTQPQTTTPTTTSSQDSGKSKQQNVSQRSSVTKSGPAAPPASNNNPPANSAPANPTSVAAPAAPVATPLTTVPQQQAAPPQPQIKAPKSHKKTDLNQKGANKEGTDMDAFRVNSTTTTPTTVAPPPEQNEYESCDNANAPAARKDNDKSPPNLDQINANTIENKDEKWTINTKVEAPAVPAPTPAPQPKTLPKNKVDVTDVFKDRKSTAPVPPLKPYTAAINSTLTTSSSVESDEPDHLALSNDKLVQAKNEANSEKIKSTTEKSDTNKFKIVYAEGQWSPTNPTGKREYSKDFIFSLQNLPKSRAKPDFHILDDVAGEPRHRFMDSKSMSGRTDFITPSFGNLGGSKSSSQQRPPLKNRSGASQSKISSMSSMSGRPNKIKISLSLSADNVKLNEVENAWKPARYVKSDKSEEEKKTEELYKKVRGVLNKLTPQKFDTLLSQVRTLPIDTRDRLEGVIGLVFDKAVDEPNFSVAYASMCKELAILQVPSDKPDDPDQIVNFRKLLVNRCQKEFEKNTREENSRTAIEKEIEECTDSQKEKELKESLEDQERRLRMKYVGNIRFIGELFKQNMLTVNIMTRCLLSLLNNKDEESLESICKLLSTIGKELEFKGVDLNEIFHAMKEIVNNKKNRISSRVRFMLQDVIDLRNSKWVPRRQDLNPKTIDQIQKEAEHEQALAATPRKDDRDRSMMRDNVGGGGSSGSMSSMNKRKVEDGSGWISSQSRGSRNQSQLFSVQIDKFKSKPPNEDAPLGSSENFSNWSRGSGSNVKSQSQNTNMYAVLANPDADKLTSFRPGGGMSKASSLERGYNRSFGGNKGGSRSGSQHRQHDGMSGDSGNSTSSGGMMQWNMQQKLPSYPQNVAAAPVSTPAPTPAPQTSQVPDMKPEQLELRIGNLLGEYIAGYTSVEDYKTEVKDWPVQWLRTLVSFSYMQVLEKNALHRIKAGELFVSLVQNNAISFADYCAGLEEVLSQAGDFVIDIPKLWDYLVDLVAKPICSEMLPLKALYECSKDIPAEYMGKFLAGLVQMVLLERGPNFFKTIWVKSGLQLSDFMPEAEVGKFVKDNKLEFLSGGECTKRESHISYEQIQAKLEEFLATNTAVDDIVKWITMNAGDRVKEDKFIRALATAGFKDSIRNKRFAIEALRKTQTLLKKYVDNDSNFELQCLYALQTLINKMEHPQGVLLAICNQLYVDGTFAQESFLTWETSSDPAEQEGKGVALKQLTSFFTSLRENDDSDDSDESPSANLTN